MTRHQKKISSKALHFCACSAVAVRYLRGGWVCARCLAAEDRLEGTRRADVLHKRGRGQSWEAVEFRCSLTR
jgi:hypothetical protein